MGTLGELILNNLGTILPAVGVPVFFALARAMFRYRPPGGLTDEQVQLLAHRARGYNASAGAFAAVVAFAAGVGCWSGCRAAADAWDRAMPPHALVLRTCDGAPPDELLAIPAIFLGIGAAFFAHVAAIRFLFGATGLLAWTIASNQKAGFDTYRVTLALSVLCVGGGAVGSALVLGSYTRAEEELFVVKEALAVGEKARPYSEVKLIARTTHVHAPNGNETLRPRLRVYFADGTEWAADHADRHQALAEFLVRRTGKRVITARHAEDLPAH